MLKRVTLYFLHILFLFSLTINAQVFPVNVTPQVIPPYSLKLSEYGSSASEKLLLNLLLTDITESNRQVRLKFYLENNAGLSVQSSDVVIGANPIFLDGGVPLRLSNIDLRPYFELQNLRGINPRQYSVPLKEGLYRFCFEVYDAISNRQISRKSCATVYLVLNDPPFLNTPRRGEQVLVRNPQNIVFDWTPRHLNATNVQYEFTISELWDTQMDPQAGFLASRPLYQTTTRATTLLYGPAEPQLLPDKMYGWRVRAVVNDGISETSVFKNDGFSEINHFTYTGDCAEPAYVLAEAKNPTTEKIMWQGVDHIRYNVEYRKKDAESSIWFEGGTINEYTSIYNLEPGTTYEFRVGGQCLDNGPYTYSQIYEFTTTLANDEESTYNCGITPEIVINNQDPLEFMSANETFTAGDFPVTVREVNGRDGTFSGWGFIIVPYLQDTKIKVSFDSVKINTDYQLIDGIVVTDYDEDWGDMASVNEIGELFEGDNDIKEIDLNFDITIDDITVNEDGSITVTHPVSGVTTDYPAGDDVVIRDTNADGSSDTFHIDEDGNIREGGPVDESGGVDPENTPGVDEDGNVEQLTAKGLKITFEKSDSYLYGFDALPSGQDDKLDKHYEIIKDVDGKPYNIINKAVGNGKTDIIIGKVEITDNSISIDSLVIKTAKGELLAHKYNATTKEVTIDLKGYYSFEHENIYAILKPSKNDEKQTIAGLFSLWHLAKKDVNVTIIPVQGASVNESQIRTGINNIFGKASVNVNLTFANAFTVDPSLYGGDDILMGESGVFANYTDEQQAIIRSYKASTTTSLESYYVFVFGSNIKPSRAGVAGFMPVKRQFGFIFSDNVSKEEEGKSSLSGTIAHELGHGIFGLEHPFSELGTSKGATEWLMDYSDGTQLSHLDWAQIHNPDFKLYLFQDDQDGEYKPWTSLDGNLISSINDPDNEGAKSFLSLTGNIVTLPANARDFTFSNNGYLLRFTIGNERYLSLSTTGNNKKFKGYYFDAKKNAQGKFSIKGSTPYSGHLDNPDGDVYIYYAKNDDSVSTTGCGASVIYKAKYEKSVLGDVNNGGIDLKTIEEDDIVGLSTVITPVKIGESSEAINCLNGRTKEFFKFVLEHYDYHGFSLDNEFQGQLIAELEKFSKGVFIKHLDGEDPATESQTTVRIREMLNYGHIEFLAKLKEVTSQGTYETLIVNFEDFNHMKDLYLTYSISQKLDANCTLFEKLQTVIDKQYKEYGEVKFNLEFFTAVGKSGYELITGNEIFELLSCLLENLKIPASVYNPNRFDSKTQDLFFELLERVYGISPESLVSKFGVTDATVDFATYGVACGCGAWNSLIDLVKGLTDLAAGLTNADLGTNVSDFFDKLFDDGGFSAMGAGMWELIKDHHGYAEGYGADSYQVTYATCYDIVFVASFFVGLGELKLISQAGRAGEISEIGMIILRSAMRSVKNTPAAWANLAKNISKLPNRAARKAVLTIADKAPKGVLDVIAKGVGTERFTAIVFHYGMQKGIAEFSAQGLRILEPIGTSSDKITKIIYKSSETLNDAARPGQKITYTIGTNSEGKIVHFIEDVANAADDIFATIQKSNEELIATLKTQNPGKTNKQIAELAKDEIKLPEYPFGYTEQQFIEAQAFIKDELVKLGVKDAEGFATGSRIFGITMNPAKTDRFGKAVVDFSKKDLDITIITPKNLPKPKLDAIKAAYKQKNGHPLGIVHIKDVRQLQYKPIYGKIPLTISASKVLDDFPRIVDKITDLGFSEATKTKFIESFGELPKTLKILDDSPDMLDAWKALDDIGVAEAVKKNVTELQEATEHVVAAGGYKAWKASEAGKVNKLWTSVSKSSNGKYYIVKYVGGASEGVGGAKLIDDGILSLDINIPQYLQKQKLGSEIIEDAIATLKPKKVQGEWAKGSKYPGGESVNLTKYRENLAKGMSKEAAALDTPTGRMMQKNGFDGKPEIIKNDLDDSVIVHFTGKGGNSGKVAVTYDDFLNYAKEAYEIYSKSLPDAIKQIEDIVGSVGKVQGRAKRAESAANRLQRAASNGWLDDLDSVEKALDNIWDALGTRVILNDGASTVDNVVNRIADAIKKGEIDIVAVNSLTGKNGIPYLTEKHLRQLEEASSSVGKSIKAVPKQYDSGYTVGTIFIKYADNVRGELQLIGSKTLKIANAEHWVYDAFLGKPYDDYLNAFAGGTKDVAKTLIEKIRKPALELSSDQRSLYNDYLNAVYQNARKIESGGTPSSVNLPSGISSNLTVDNLIKTDELLEGLKSGSVNTQEVQSFINTLD